MHENSCRICLTSEGRTLIDLFCANNYASKVEFCSGIQMSETIDLPRMICKDCLDRVAAACEIKAKCIETDKLLRQTLKGEPPETSVKLEKKEAENLEGDLKADIVTDQATPWYEKSKEKFAINECVEVPKRKRRRKKDQNESAHRKRQPKAHDFQCFICDKIFERIGLKQDHIRREHAAEEACKICNKKRKSALAIEICIKEHKFGQEFLCQVCAKTFRFRAGLLYHQATYHTKRESFTCDRCGLRIKYKENLLRHMMSIHANASKRFNCPHDDSCPRMSYTTKESLNIHLYRVHNVAAPVNCTTCSLGFTYASELKVHLKFCGGNSRAPRRNVNSKLRKVSSLSEFLK